MCIWMCLWSWPASHTVNCCLIATCLLFSTLQPVSASTAHILGEVCREKQEAAIPLVRLFLHYGKIVPFISAIAHAEVNRTQWVSCRIFTLGITPETTVRQLIIHCPFCGHSIKCIYHSASDVGGFPYLENNFVIVLYLLDIYCSIISFVSNNMSTFECCILVFFSLYKKNLILLSV